VRLTFSGTPPPTCVASSTVQVGAPTQFSNDDLAGLASFEERVLRAVARADALRLLTGPAVHPLRRSSIESGLQEEHMQVDERSLDALVGRIVAATAQRDAYLQAREELVVVAHTAPAGS